MSQNQNHICLKMLTTKKPLAIARHLGARHSFNLTKNCLKGLFFTLVNKLSFFQKALRLHHSFDNFVYCSTSSFYKTKAGVTFYVA